MSTRTSGLLIVVGALIVLIGVILRYFPWLFSWFGHLPGDIRRETESTTVFIPITSMLVVSVVGTLILNLASRFFRGE
ncbi:MAG TPA: DUF2905 domain-containing protein [Acidimicrobiia bacterium]|nr:DUF2905 domain-containing protein [Acidimicrobiia bacterium]